MSIPERFYRIARGKFNELRDRMDDLDAETQEREAQREQTIATRRQSRQDAARELGESPGDSQLKAAKVHAPDLGGIQPRMRTPEEIRKGTPASPNSSMSQTNTEYDPLTPHYNLLGIEVGSDFQTAQAAYQRLLLRCDVSRFPVGSPEAQDAQRIRERLEETFHALKDALDPVSRRFDILELDELPVQPESAK